ncbi:immunoglobulin superfamily member 1 isoform X2 [Cuculus canorus]|uniref:immunoglobulin superfamily member 1 isoform X2 n=1 Tax=Cuculus canorus TaxID=55661 RepID=UPI0023AAD75D|nr:immunoglobulin superfamily member 1 isoform X2 [Cuculus canorus]
MLAVTYGLAFGAWLVAQNKATSSPPTVFIFLQPPGVIPPGGSTTICCSCRCDSGKFVLYRNGIKLRTLELRGSRAEFSIYNATKSDRGSYSCHYLDGGNVLAYSNSVEVRVEDFHLHKPVLSILPGLEVNAGAYVTVRCTIEDSDAGCFLYLEGQAKDFPFLPKGQDNINLSHVHKGNEGRYSCQCFTGVSSIKWSATSEPLYLVVKDYTWINMVRLVLGSGVLLLLGLIVAEALCTHRLGSR